MSHVISPSVYKYDVLVGICKGKSAHAEFLPRYTNAPWRIQRQEFCREYFLSFFAFCYCIIYASVCKHVVLMGRCKGNGALQNSCLSLQTYLDAHRRFSHNFNVFYNSDVFRWFLIILTFFSQNPSVAFNQAEITGGRRKSVFNKSREFSIFPWK